MIAIFELEFTKWQHIECNAGMIKLLSKATDEKIVLFCTESHFQALKSEGIPEDINYHMINIYPFSECQNYNHVNYYSEIINNSLKIYDNISMVIFLSSEYVLLKSILQADSISRGMKTLCVLHANLDRILFPKQEIDFFSQKDFIEACKRPNIRFISFSPCAKKIITEILGVECCNKFFFLHIPISVTTRLKKKNEKIVIGVYGLAVNDNLSRFLHEYEKFQWNRLIIRIYRRASVDNLDYRAWRIPKKGIEYHEKIDGFEKEDLNEYRKEMDYILLPYSQEKYIASMSGILADAIGSKIPVLCLDSNATSWYSKYNIGMCAQNVKQLCELVYREVELENNGNYQQYVDNMTLLQQLMINENLKFVRNFLTWE